MRPLTRKPVPTMKYRNNHWASYDDERPLSFNAAGTPIPVIPVALGRSRWAIEKRLAALKKQKIEIDRSGEAHRESSAKR